MKTFKEFLNEADDGTQEVTLHRLRQDGTESKRETSRVSFNTLASAILHHQMVKGLSPVSKVEHNLYVNGELKDKLV